MATYKVIQDIEAEDKLVGPLSLRQFIYAGITILTTFIAYKFASLSILLIIPFIPVIVLFGVLAAPFGRDQPSEIWLLAKIRFFLKPHNRIWNQDGAINLVTITAPKTLQKQLTKNLTQNEVSSRLKALANTIDSRGWAIKNVNVNLAGQIASGYNDYSSQRLINPSSLPQDVPNVTVTAADDILDPVSNPTAQHLDQMINASDKAHRKRVIESVSNPIPQTQQTANPPDYWFMNNAPAKSAPQSGYANFTSTNLVQPGDDGSKYAGAVQTADDDQLLNEIERKKEFERQIMNSNIRNIRPIADQPLVPVPAPQPQINANPPVTVPTNPDIINLALANKDNWSLTTIQHMAEQANKKQEPPQDEIVIPLH